MRAIVFLTCVLFAATASAQLRSIPDDAKRAEMTHVGENVVEVNREELRLSPGAQIRDTMNRVVMPATLPPRSPVRYQLDAVGLVHRVWILSPEEADRPEQ